MEDYIKNAISILFRLHWERNRKRLIAVLCAAGLLLVAVTAGLAYLRQGNFWEDVWSIFIDMIASFIAVIIVYYIVLVVSSLLRKHEDELKVSYRNSDMEAIYTAKSPYRQEFVLNDGLPFIVYCDPLFIMDERTEVEIDDHPERLFELDTFIKMHAVELYDAHAQSLLKPTLTVRLCGFTAPTAANGYTATLTTMRSTYMAHLLTNRALDLKLENNLTLRKLYEYNDRLSSPEHSKMSNHLGANALVFLTGDGRDGKKTLLLPKRGDDATIAKNGVTASIAVRLQMKGERFPEGYAQSLNKEKQFIYGECLKECVRDSLLLDPQHVEEVQNLMHRNTKFLGLARDPYEGGKPTLFYVVYLPLTKEQFWAKMDADYKPSGMDGVQELLFVDWKDVHMAVNEEDPAKSYDNGHLRLVNVYHRGAKDPVGEEEYMFEQNLISNIWFYTESQKER